MNRHMFLSLLLLVSGAVLADEPPETDGTAAEEQVRAEENAKALSGDSDEAPDTDRAGESSGEQAQTEEGAKLISGMSILGNQEAPKSLVIVPWKSSEIGESPGISTILDDSRQPVDKEVFMRSLNYYEIRSERRP